jgi:hypothetical protein
MVDNTGTLLDEARIDDNANGLAHLLQMLTEHGDTAEDPIPVAIETSRGLLVACHYPCRWTSPAPTCTTVPVWSHRCAGSRPSAPGPAPVADDRPSSTPTTHQLPPTHELKRRLTTSTRAPVLKARKGYRAGRLPVQCTEPPPSRGE